MLHELERGQFEKALPLFVGYLQDPMMHAVIEGRLRGRVFVDNTTSPVAAFVWTGTECAYLAGGKESSRFRQALYELVVEEIIPSAQASDREYLSLFSFPESYAAELERLFGPHLPLKTPLSTFAFDEDTFYRRRREPGGSLGSALELKRIGSAELADPQNAYLSGEIETYWDTTERFEDEGCGYCALDGDSLVGWCYVQAYGHGSQTIDIWTAPSHRRRGLGTLVGAAVIERSLAEGYKPFWICDKANMPSRKLAERLGFHHTGDIDLVDIPFEPYGFYLSLAKRFFLPQGDHRQAAEAFERAFRVQQGEAKDYYHAAVAWALAGEKDRALVYLQKAIDNGWNDME
ncbi:MAG: GNAT family N-acetyltransferase [Anaerolineae bacterium]|nr:GNAT family N-acetyltransferase [Anaerolineae bacterium]